MPENTWWKRGIVYQIYPRSFQDSNGDGIGDLAGIRSRLDYLEGLGIDALWISPIYTSPMRDFGYDVADYCGIDPIFGSLDDFDALVVDVHARGLKLILDFVPNHSSDQHPWFRESRSSRDNPKRDWYIWRDGKADGGPPNNWLSNFGGPGWTLDERTGQYYYHAFLKEQPDLNWRNPEVREAMSEALRFWLRRGVDGFRVDVIWHLMKDPAFQDNPPDPSWREGRPEIDSLIQVHSNGHNDIYGIVNGLRRVLEEFDDRVLIGEIYLPIERLVTYYGTPDLPGAHLPFNFQLIFASWHAEALARMITEYESHVPETGWPNWVLGNHDQRRIAARLGQAQARVAAVLLLTLRGTPTMYYGDEIGMPHVQIPARLAQDPWEHNEPGHGFGRDPQRTPMLWDGSPNAGFSTARPWLPLAGDWAVRNVAAFDDDPSSILWLYRRLIELRRSHLALSVGSFSLISRVGQVLAYERRHGEERLVVVLNLGHEPHDLPAKIVGGGHVILSTLPERELSPADVPLTVLADEALILSFDP
jgi:alpha-glucosidase